MSQITVIVPIYNVEAYLHHCIDSILNQTFSDFDLILIDDGSSDQRGLICDEYADIDSRVYVIHQPNQGVSVARNSGINWAFSKSSSQWITFIDSDDWVHPLYLEALLSAAQGYDLSVCFRAKTHGEDLPVITTYTVSLLKPEDYYFMPNSNFTVLWAKLYAKSLFESIRFPVGRIHEDEYVTYRLLFSYSYIPFISEPLYAHLIRPDSIFHRPWTPERLAALDAFEEQIAFFEQRGLHNLSEHRFRILIKHNLAATKQISCYPGLTQEEANSLQRKTKRQIRRVLLRYHRKRWLLPIKKSDDLQIYLGAFPILRTIYPFVHWL